MLSHDSFKVSKVEFNQIQGGEDIISSAKIFMNVIQNKGTEAQQNVVCANAGMAISTALGLEPIDGFMRAKESLQSGNALELYVCVVLLRFMCIFVIAFWYMFCFLI